MRDRLLSTWPLAGLFFLFGLAATPALRADVIITELMATNVKTLVDEDGDYPDWIELYNSGDTAVDLSGWSLTDSHSHKTRWDFPQVTLDPRRFLVVFASGKSRNDPAGRLHTSFKLSDTGGYLALLNPDHSLSSELRYPAQAAGASWGPSMSISSETLVDAGATGRYAIPIDDTLDAVWTDPAFDDGSWPSGATGIGYDTKTTPTYQDLIATDIGVAMKGVGTSAYIRIPFTWDGSAFNALLLRMKYEDGFIAWINGTKVASKNAPTGVNWSAKAA